MAGVPKNLTKQELGQMMLRYQASSVKFFKRWEKSQKELEQAKGDLSQELERAQGVQEELAFARQEVARLEHRFYEVQDRNAEEHITQLEREQASLLAQIATLEERLALLQATFEEVQQANTSCGDNLEQSEAEKAALGRDLELAQEENAQLVDELELVRSELEELKSRPSTHHGVKVTDLYKPPEPIDDPSHKQLEEYISKMEDFLGEVTVANVERFVLSKLKGTAFSHMSSTIQGQKDKGTFRATWAHMKGILKDRFGATNAVKKARKELYELAFTHGHYKHYVTSTRRLHLEMKEEPMSEYDKLFLHINGIKVKELRDKVEFNPSTLEEWGTLEELIDFALPKYGDKKYGKEDGLKSNAPSNPSHEGNKRGHQDPPHGSGKKFKKDFSKGESNKSNEGKSQEKDKPKKEHYGCSMTQAARTWCKSNGRCFRCGEKHRIQECKSTVKKLPSDMPENLKKQCST